MGNQPSSEPAIAEAEGFAEEGAEWKGEPYPDLPPPVTTGYGERLLTRPVLTEILDEEKRKADRDFFLEIIRERLKRAREGHPPEKEEKEEKDEKEGKEGKEQEQQAQQQQQQQDGKTNEEKEGKEEKTTAQQPPKQKKKQRALETMYRSPWSMLIKQLDLRPCPTTDPSSTDNNSSSSSSSSSAEPAPSVPRLDAVLSDVDMRALVKQLTRSRTIALDLRGNSISELGLALLTLAILEAQDRNTLHITPEEHQAAGRYYAYREQIVNDLKARLRAAEEAVRPGGTYSPTMTAAIETVMAQVRRRLITGGGKIFRFSLFGERDD